MLAHHRTPISLFSLSPCIALPQYEKALGSNPNREKLLRIDVVQW